MGFESTNDALISKRSFFFRVVRSFGATLVVVLFSLAIGSAGYSYFGEMGQVDALLNAAMILTGMGPVDRMVTTSGKLFANFYALYSGIAFLSMMAIMIAPILHRFLHRFHLEDD